MNYESTIRTKLREACTKRGAQAEIARAFDVSQSTVKRWIEGGEIPPPMLKLLDWYFFGTLPPQIAERSNQTGVLDFTKEEWNIIRLLASRAGQTPGMWIACTIRVHLDIERSQQQAKKRGPMVHDFA